MISRRPTPDDIQCLIDHKHTTAYTEFFRTYHEADIAEQLSNLPLTTQHQFFLNVTPELGADVLESMTLTQQIELIQQRV